MSAEAVERFNIHEAKTNLSKLIERVEHGEEIIISRAGQPVAKIIPLGRQARMASFGSLKGKIVLDEVWDSPQTNEAIARDFGLCE
jgi:prevent-host-death family protein